MKRMIQLKGLKEGEFLNKYKENKINNNQNVLGVTSGGTGSGKSYIDLSSANSWYRFKFNEEFPIDNVHFSPGELIKRINHLQEKKKLRKGEEFILEESGTGLGNLDFQDKYSKLFVYILQSFRSLNLILMMNLPVLTMLNKSARQLIHFNFITAGIDREKKLGKVKPLFHQLNQHSGKSYWKYPRVRINKRVITLERLRFSMPPKKLIEEYEAKKFKFVNSLTQSFIDKIDEKEKDDIMKMARKQLSIVELEIFEDISKGLSVEESAKKHKRTGRATYQALSRIKSKGYIIKNNKKLQNV